MDTSPQTDRNALAALLELAREPLLAVRLAEPAPADAPLRDLLRHALRGGRIVFANAAGHRALEDFGVDRTGGGLAEAFGDDPDALLALLGSEDAVSAFDGEGGTTWLALRVGDGSTPEARRLQTAGLLVNGIAHDYHNLLTVMLGSAELAMQQARQGDPTPHLEEIHAAARSAASLGQQLAALSYEREPELQPCDLAPILNRTVGTLRRLLDPSTQLTLEVVPDTPRVTADPRQLEQALIGMLLSVRAALPVDARIRVQASEVDERQLVRLRVLGRHDAVRGVAPGGPGLALARAVAAGAGAWLDVEPVPDGAAVTMWLQPAHGGPRPLRESRAEARSQGDGELVLLVDDHDVLRNFVARFLRSHGYEVHAVTCPAEALEMPPEDRRAVSLIVSDVLMPAMSGPEFVARWREEFPGTPALFTTGAAGSRTELEHWFGDRWKLLEKPFRNDELLAALRELRDERDD